MPIVANPNAAPSNLSAVTRAIVDIFRDIGDATPIMVGEAYAKDGRGVGTPPCVILVPEPGNGRCKIEKPYESGRPAKQVHVCDVIVRAAETGSDDTRHVNVYDLNDLVISAVGRACSGRWVPQDAVGDYPSPFGVDSGAGTQLCWGFTYDRDIKFDPRVLGLPRSAPDETPTQPYAQPGETGTIDSATGTVTVPNEDA